MKYITIWHNANKKECRKVFRNERKAHEFAYDMDRKGIFVKVEELED